MPLISTCAQSSVSRPETWFLSVMRQIPRSLSQAHFSTLVLSCIYFSSWYLSAKPKALFLRQQSVAPGGDGRLIYLGNSLGCRHRRRKNGTSSGSVRMSWIVRHTNAERGGWLSLHMCRYVKGSTQIEHNVSLIDSPPRRKGRTYVARDAFQH